MKRRELIKKLEFNGWYLVRNGANHDIYSNGKEMFDLKAVYPIILSPIGKGFLVYVPDFDINTEGSDMADAIFMARDAIAMAGCFKEDQGEALPAPSEIKSVKAEPGETVTLVDVDFELYRKKNDNRAVRKNVTIPSWLNMEAEKAGVNFSAILQNALKQQLGLKS